MNLALVLRGPAPAARWHMAEVPDNLLGTGQKILVWDSDQIKERTASEGTPIVLVNGELRLLQAGETLES
jgi:hypothetical protein